MELINSEFDAGSHTISFSADGLTSGIYFYKMEAGNFIADEKCLYSNSRYNNSHIT